MRHPLERIVSLPALPTEISGDGREVWDWAAKLSDRAHTVDQIKRLDEQARNARNTCGSCAQWMTRACPREKHSNQTGRSAGPSCKAAKCASFNITASAEKSAASAEAQAAELRTKLQAS